jgi:hypothetical protein
MNNPLLGTFLKVQVEELLLAVFRQLKRNIAQKKRRETLAQESGEQPSGRQPDSAGEEITVSRQPPRASAKPLSWICPTLDRSMEHAGRRPGDCRELGRRLCLHWQRGKPLPRARWIGLSWPTTVSGGRKLSSSTLFLTTNGPLVAGNAGRDVKSSYKVSHPRE